MTDSPHNLSSAEGKLTVNHRQAVEARDDVLARLREIGARRFSIEGNTDEISGPFNLTPDAPEPADPDDVVIFSEGRQAFRNADTRRFQRETIERQEQLIDGIMALVSLAQADDRENARRHRQTLVVAWIAAVAGIGSILVTVF